MIKKLLSLSENLFTKTAFLTFAFRSKCRVNKSTSCKKKKNREKTNTPLRVVKNREKTNTPLRVVKNLKKTNTPLRVVIKKDSAPI